MSLSYQPLETALVRDPITMVDSKREYAILKGGNQVTWKQYNTTSISNSSIVFSAPPPSGNVFVDRKQYLMLPVRLIINGNVAGGATQLLNSGFDAPRAWPLMGALETLQASINGQSFSIYISDMVHALTHYNTDIKLNNGDYSLTPTYSDQSQEYSDLAGANASVRNPLGFYGNGLHQCPMPRGGFPFNVVENTATRAIVDMVICEPLFLSPFFWGCGNASGFYNVTTMDFTFNFLTNAGNRMWSHLSDLGAGATSNITSIETRFNNFDAGLPGGYSFTYVDNTPRLFFKYITPDATQILSPNMPITYPYFDVQRYITAQPQISASASSQVISNNLQLNSIPRMMYLYVRHRNQDLYASPNLTDTFLSIEGCNITFANYTGLLANANQRQLYKISVKNGVDMSFTQWSGIPVSSASLVVAAPPVPQTRYGTVGSVLAVEFATDLGLPSDMAPGLQGQFTLQVTLNVRNTSGQTINPEFYVIIVNEGSFTIPGLNSATKQLGIISKEDVLNAQKQQGIDYDDVKEDGYGGNFLSGLKKFGHKFNKFLRKHKPISTITGMIPGPRAQIASQVARSLGYGNGGVVVDPSQYGGEYDEEFEDFDEYEGDGVLVGGVPVAGGARLSRKSLRKRLKDL